MSENPPAIEMRGVDVGAMRDQTLTIVENVTWSVAPGEFWVLAGPQRSGKSDLLMLAAGLMGPVKGRYEFFGNRMPLFDEAQLGERLRLGFVFENGGLFRHLTIAENLALPLRYHGRMTDGATEEAVGKLLELTGLTPLAGQAPAHVGRSWLKRAGLARALALQPGVLLLDNPLGGLDARHARWWLGFLDELRRGHEWAGGKPMTLVVTADDLRPWRGGARRFALLKEKKFIPLGAWSEVENARDPAVEELLAAPLELAS
ncbi:MAG: ATP-binding cassette domain-containing protein [Verrucomicrobiota bacterium]|nr:ATP-binding cassette domain-containing protein [Verrucomicrobiota bacterium]